MLLYNIIVPREQAQIQVQEEMNMKKYEVWATVWDRKEEKQIKVVAGTFDKITNAIIFRDAYNKNYRANAEIVEKQA